MTAPSGASPPEPGAGLPHGPDTSAARGPDVGPAHGPDAGAARERTRLAWRRTSLSLTAVAMLTLRVASRTRLDALGVLAIAVALLGWVALLAAIQLRVQAVSAQRITGAGRLLPTLVLGMLGYGLLGLVLTLRA